MGNMGKGTWIKDNHKNIALNKVFADADLYESSPLMWSEQPCCRSHNFLSSLFDLLRGAH
jgi:hypothetical protein